MKIDKTLNIVLPIYEDDPDAPLPKAGEQAKAGKPKFYVHSAPVDTGVWDQYWEPVSLAFTRVMQHGMMGGPRIAHKMLRKVSEELGVWDTKDAPYSVKRGLVAEIHRNTNVLMTTPERGWESVPYDDAVKAKWISAEDADDVEGALVYFMLVSLMNRRTARRTILSGGMQLWGARTSSLNSTELVNSLSTSTEDESIGVKDEEES